PPAAFGGLGLLLPPGDALSDRLRCRGPGALPAARERPSYEHRQDGERDAAGLQEGVRLARSGRAVAAKARLRTPAPHPGGLLLPGAAAATFHAAHVRERALRPAELRLFRRISSAGHFAASSPVIVAVRTTIIRGLRFALRVYPFL